MRPKLPRRVRRSQSWWALSKLPLYTISRDPSLQFEITRLKREWVGQHEHPEFQMNKK